MNLRRREDFLTFASLFMAALLLLTWLLARVSGVNPALTMHLNLREVGVGIAAGFGMLVVFSLVPSVRNQAEESLGAALADCRWYDYIPLSLAVGIVEELLFRGVLEPWGARLNPVASFFVVNAFFGLLHAVSWTYGLVAMALGCVLSLLTHGWEPANLVRPIVAHAVYDYVGFLWIAHSYRRTHPLPDDLPAPPLEDSYHVD